MFPGAFQGGTYGVADGNCTEVTAEVAFEPDSEALERGG